MRLLSLVSILLLSFPSFAQDTKVLEPENIGVVVYLDSAHNSLLDLEAQTITTKTKIKALGYGGAKSTAEIPGDKSPVRLSADQKLEFVVSLANGVDPKQLTLHRFDKAKDKRQVLLAKATMFGGSAHAGSIRVNILRHGQSSYRLIPAEPLLPGEYGFTFAISGSTDIFCFGVDSPSKSQ